MGPEEQSRSDYCTLDSHKQGSAIGGLNSCREIAEPYYSGLSTDRLDMIKHGMGTLEDDVGCMKFPFVDRSVLSMTSWQSGIDWG